MLRLPLPDIDRLAAYLVACGGSDRFEFHDHQGEPDPLAARDFAESLRGQLGARLDLDISVRQSANRVAVAMHEPAALLTR